MPNNPILDTAGIITGLVTPPHTDSESKAPVTRPPIRVKSLDFDGCMFNQEYINLYLKNNYYFDSDIPKFEEDVDPLFTTNKVFFEEVKKECSESKYQKLILLCGSLRQDEVGDAINSNGQAPQDCCKLRSESAFSALTKIKDKLSKEIETKCVLDKFLTSDLCNEEKHGTNFDQTISNRHLINKPEYSFSSKTFSDQTKISLLYTQIHKIASEHPGDTIIFDFYDDQRYINNALGYSFSEHPDLLPKNVTLNLKPYAGRFLSPTKPIQGTGEIDFNYAENIGLLLQHALQKKDKIDLKDYFNYCGDIDLLMQQNQMYPEFLKTRTLRKNLESAETISQTPTEVQAPTLSLT